MSKPSVEVLAANITALRDWPGMPKSQADIAEKAGLDQTTVSRTLRGTNAIGIDKLDGLAKGFGLEAWQLLAPGMAASVAGMSPRALEVAMMFEALSPAKQNHLHDTAKVLHYPESFDDAFDDQEASTVPLESRAFK